MESARVFSVDHWPTRLKKTKELGAEIINFDNEDPADIIKKETNGKGAICIDAVGYEAVGHMVGNGGEAVKIIKIRVMIIQKYPILRMSPLIHYK